MRISPFGHSHLRQSNTACFPEHAFAARRLAGCATALLIGCLGWYGAHAAPPEQAQAPARKFVPGRLLVQPRAGLPAAELDKIVGQHGGKRAQRLAQINLQVIDLPAGADVEAIAKVLKRHRHLKFAEPDMLVGPGFTPNDPYFSNAWHLPKIGAPAAWDTANGQGVTIAILDTGVDGTHPDLTPKMVPGWNMYDNNSDTRDIHGHGTAVAGTAAAIGNNGVGVASVAPNAKIMPLRIADPSGYGYYSTIAQGLSWAADHGANVANISFLGVAGSASIQSAAQYFKSKGGVTVVAAGNNGIDEGIAASDTVIAVSATDSSDAKTSWSSFGSFVDISAPGASIWTTTNGGGYGAWSGTSFASPVVAGVVGLMKSANPLLSPTQIESLLFANTVDLGNPGKDAWFGSGRVNAGAAVLAAFNTPSRDTQPPSVSVTNPAGGTVSGLVPVDVSAADNVGVVRVDLLVNDTAIASDTTMPFGFSWDSKSVPDGQARLVAYAYDAAGNYAASNVTTVSVANTPDNTAPTVKIANPANGARIGRNVSINVSSADNLGAAGIKQSLYIDGALKATATGGTLTYGWNTRKVAAGTHTIRAVAKDAAGNSASATISVVK